MKATIFILAFFYSTTIFGSEKLLTNFADRISTLAKIFTSIHVPLKRRSPKEEKWDPCGQKVKKVSIKINQLQEMEKAIIAIEEFDWERGKREDATTLMKKGIGFVLELNEANELFTIENQYQEDNALITIFSDQTEEDLNWVKLVYSRLPGKIAVEGIEFVD